MIDPTTLRWEAFNSFGLQAGFDDNDVIVLYRMQTNKTGVYVYSYDAETIDDLISGSNGLPSGGTIGQSIENSMPGTGIWIDIPSKIQEQLNIKQNSILEDIVPINSTIVSGDTVEEAVEKAQGQINELNFVVNDEIESPILDGLSDISVAFGVKRLKTGQNKAFKVRRDIDNLAIDFYFEYDGNVNVNQLSQFLYGGRGYIEIWYDQSGNNNHATQSTQSLQPIVYIQNGDIVIMFENNGNGTIGQQLNYSTSPIDVANTCIIASYEAYVGSGMNISPVPNFTKRYFLSSANEKLDFYINSNNGGTVDFDYLELFSGTSRTDKTLYAYSSANYFSINSSASNLTIETNYKSENLLSITSTNETQFAIGNKFTGQNNPFTGVFYSYIQFSSSQTQLTIDNLKLQSERLFKLVSISDSQLNIVLEGDSLTNGLGATYNQNYPKQLSSILKAQVLDIAISGNTISDISNKSNHVDKNIKFGKTNILIVWIGTNDMYNLGRTETQAYNDLVTYVQNRRIAGWNKIYALTCIARGNTIKTVFNNLLLSNTTDFDSIIDVAGDTRFQVKTGVVNAIDNLYYIADAIHLTNAGYRAIASIIDPYIQQNNTLFNQNQTIGYRLNTIENIVNTLTKTFATITKDPQYNSSIAVKENIYTPNIIGGTTPGTNLTLRGSDALNPNNQGNTIVEPTGDGKFIFGANSTTSQATYSIIKPTGVQRGQDLFVLIANKNTSNANKIIFASADNVAENVARGSVGYDVTRGFGLYSQTNLNLRYGVSGGVLSIVGTANEVARFRNEDGLALFPRGATGFNPTAFLHIARGIAAAGGAPIKFGLTGGALLTVPEAGALEAGATDNRLYYTGSSSVRKTIAFLDDIQSNNVISSTATLSLTTGGYYTFNGVTAIWTLPVITGNTGIRFLIMNQGSGNLTINTNAGGNDIYMGGSSVNTIILGVGEIAVLYNNSISWFRQL